MCVCALCVCVCVSFVLFGVQAPARCPPSHEVRKAPTGNDLRAVYDGLIFRILRSGKSTSERANERNAEALHDVVGRGVRRPLGQALELPLFKDAAHAR